MYSSTTPPVHAENRLSGHLTICPSYFLNTLLIDYSKPTIDHRLINKKQRKNGVKRGKFDSMPGKGRH